jgi:release factor glutamine methyltransferase
MFREKIIPYLAGRLYKPMLRRYLSRERVYRYNGINLLVHPEVFHPGFFFSTRLLLQYLLKLPLQKKSLLELGAGSGLIAFSAARAGAEVTAADINPVAVRYLYRNKERNGIDIQCIESDLFNDLPGKTYDFILINPPYYFKTPMNMSGHAWYCGEQGEYFQRLFEGIGNYMDQNTVTLMILCEGCEQERIKALAGDAGYELYMMQTNRNLIERNDIYEIRKQKEIH